MRCTYCNTSVGAVVECAHSSCHKRFHPLCARKAGCFAVCRHLSGRGRPVYKTWCLEHGEGVRRRETALSNAITSGDDSLVASKTRASTGGGGVALDLGDQAALDAKIAEFEVFNVVRIDLETLRIIVSQVSSVLKIDPHCECVSVCCSIEN